MPKVMEEKEPRWTEGSTMPMSLKDEAMVGVAWSRTTPLGGVRVICESPRATMLALAMRVAKFEQTVGQDGCEFFGRFG